ncbi:phosphoribosyl transferase domain protein [Paraphoma chrysanthemicola]|uniref:Phosphoribosyl transferase domain protein n=1 Tax=Paraphoma chrysanthemicola TaxID=798071 RepID=A0A8K0VRC2_9PLEO|nr:phosphoribosyl transferase domain protein [Paraphoma chrysanthemicola]
MATLNELKHALRQAAKATPHQPLSETQYSAGFQILIQDAGWMVYKDFVIPQLSRLLTNQYASRTDISVLEIGPGPQSVLAHLPSDLRRKIKTYNAVEPNGLFAARLGEQLQPTTQTELPLPCLARPVNICRCPFVLQDGVESCANPDSHPSDRFDLILFCHSMYGMKLKHTIVEKALEMLTERPQPGLVVVFHRDGLLLQDLVCHQIASYPAGAVRVIDNNDNLDSFASFVAGYTLPDASEENTIKISWRGICRSLGCLEKGHLSFSSPHIMMGFTRHAAALQELKAQMPLSKRSKTIKNRESLFQSPACVVKPTTIEHVQDCVRWALTRGLSLTIIGGGHSGHCLLSNVVAVDLSAFDQVHILNADDTGEVRGLSDASASLVVAEAGSTVGDVIRRATTAGVTVPLGARPSVGAGLWLQGGIGHLARQHGLSCDAIVGAVIISVRTGQIFCVGNLPNKHMPAGAIRPEEEEDLLWAIKGAGTNFGIVISVTFKAYAAATYLTRNRIIPLDTKVEAEQQLHSFDTSVARKLNRKCSADAYLYWNADKLHLGVTTFECSTAKSTSEISTTIPEGVLLGSQDEVRIVDDIGLFEADMYMSGMHGGHGGGKTSSFKRCVFLKYIGEAEIRGRLVVAIENRPSNLCYLHLLQGGGAIGDIEGRATAFGCRDWHFACVITGVWPREQDGTALARAVQQWVYDVVEDLLPLSCGAYGADLGPDPRDAALAAMAFGSNLSRLVRLKSRFDPNNVLAHACPLSRAPMPKLIILVTGESCAGKDHCAELWVSVLSRATSEGLLVRAVSISDATKREYAEATGADLHRLLGDRSFREQHRPALTAFFQEQVRQRPNLPQEHFLDVVRRVVGVDVLLITGMRDEAPVATLCHLVPESRLIEVHVQADARTRRLRRGCHDDELDGRERKSESDSTTSVDSALLNHRPTFIFDNNTAGNERAEEFAEQIILPFLHRDLERLADMVRTVSDFPSSGIEFRHVLGIAQQPGGLALCTSLLQEHLKHDWTNFGAIACCEVGGFVYASTLALQVGVPLILVREAGKLPPPSISVAKTPSHISSAASNGPKQYQIEIERDAIAVGASVVVIDDVLATGETLCAVVQLLHKAGVSTNHIRIMVVAEFPSHRGRELLRRRGFGKVSVQSLLVFPGS